MKKFAKVIFNIFSGNTIVFDFICFDELIFKNEKFKKKYEKK